MGVDGPLYASLLRAPLWGVNKKAEMDITHDFRVYKFDDIHVEGNSYSFLCKHGTKKGGWVRGGGLHHVLE